MNKKSEQEDIDFLHDQRGPRKMSIGCKDKQYTAAVERKEKKQKEREVEIKLETLSGNTVEKKARRSATVKLKSLVR